MNRFFKMFARFYRAPKGETPEERERRESEIAALERERQRRIAVNEKVVTRQISQARDFRRHFLEVSAQLGGEPRKFRRRIARAKVHRERRAKLFTKTLQEMREVK